MEPPSGVGVRGPTGNAASPRVAHPTYPPTLPPFTLQQFPLRDRAPYTLTASANHPHHVQLYSDLLYCVTKLYL